MRRSTRARCWFFSAGAFQNETNGSTSAGGLLASRGLTCRSCRQKCPCGWTKSTAHHLGTSAFSGKYQHAMVSTMASKWCRILSIHSMPQVSSGSRWAGGYKSPLRISWGRDWQFRSLRFRQEQGENLLTRRRTMFFVVFETPDLDPTTKSLRKVPQADSWTTRLSPEEVG